MTMLIYDLIGIVGLVVVLIYILEFVQRRSSKIDPKYFLSKWQELQTFCADKNTWSLAIINADKLLDEALRKKHFKGKTMGERLVSAQHNLSDNDSVWFGHKLRNRLVHEADIKLRKRDVRDALIGIRQALRDLKALR